LLQLVRVPHVQRDFDIRLDDLTGDQTRALLALHLQGMHASSPPGHVFALDLSGLQKPNVTVWTAWHGDRIAGVGALKQLDARTDESKSGDSKSCDSKSGELKSMRTHPDFLRRGVGAVVLEHIIVEARGRGLARLSLETGRGPAFEAALALYRRRGFVDGGVFGDYTQSDFNQFLHLDLG
jgi:putative acetyltransferase